MNEDMRDEHFERITDQKARNMYNYLCDACEKRADGMTDPDQMLIGDVAFAEQVKGQLMDDIAKRGIGAERTNGKQKYYQENKSLGQYRAYCEQQRKQLAELRLTPNGRKAANVPIDDDDFDNFE